MRSIIWSARIGAVVVLTVAAYLFTLGHDDLIVLVSKASGYNKVDKIAEQLTPLRANMLRGGLLGAALLLSIIARFPRSIIVPMMMLREAFSYGVSMIKKVWNDMGLQERVVFLSLMLLGAGTRTWLAMHEPANVDETLTWLLFTSRGPLVAATYYPAPNNHILHSILTTFASHLPFDALLAIRVPTLVIALCAQGLLHLLLRRIAGFAAATLAIALAIGCYPFLLYGFLSRGYMLVVLAFIVAYGATILFVRNGDRKALHLAAIACVMGLFTMPSFLYPTAILYFYLLFSRVGWATRDSRLAVLRSGLAAGAAAVLLYLPALMMSGIASFTQNQWVKPIGRAEVLAGWWPHFQSTFDWITGTTIGPWLVLALVVLPLLTTTGAARSVARLNAFVVFGSLLIPLVHGVIGFERTWIHLLVVLAGAVALLVGHFSATLDRKLLVVLPLTLAILFISMRRFQHVNPQLEYLAYSSRSVYDVVVPMERKDIYCEFVVVGDNLTFELKSRGIPYSYTLSPEGKDRASLLGSNSYSILVVREAQPLEKPGYVQVFSDPILRVYTPVDP